MIRRLGLLLLALGVWLTGGCASVNPATEFAGVYKSRSNDWSVTIYKDGTFEYAFWPAADGGESFKGSGYCNFAVDDPLYPELTVYLSYMQDKFAFAFSSDKRQLAVLVLLPDESRIVLENGKQVLLYRVGDVGERGGSLMN